MQELRLGQIITGHHQRDAIHIAVAPVTAGHKLSPGAHVMVRGTSAFHANNIEIAGIGVVDPFLTTTIEPGQRFWLFLYPNTITSLRHEWAHPAFSISGYGVASESEKWLRDFAHQVDADYDEMMSVAESHTREGWGDYLCEGGKWEGQGTPTEFWEHFKNVTGKSPHDTKSGSPGIFSCSC
jgi:hypothetical protein